MQPCIAPLPQRSNALSPEQIKDRIMPRIFSSVHQAERIRNLITVPLAADLVLCFYADVSDLLQPGEDISAYIPVDSDLAHTLGLSVEDLITLGKAHASSTYRVQSMSEVMSDLFGMPEGIGASAPPMYVVGCRDIKYGAAAVLDAGVRAKLDKCCPEGYFLLPSSVHEMLAIPKQSADPDILVQMVTEINREGDVVTPDEVLSDHVYTVEAGMLVAVI